jgi:hypothetical protein
MKNTNQLGLWMDDSVAYLIQFTTKPYNSNNCAEFQTEEKKIKPFKKNFITKSL